MDLMLLGRKIRDRRIIFGRSENEREFAECYGTNDFWGISRINAPIGDMDSPSNISASPSPVATPDSSNTGPQVDGH